MWRSSGIIVVLVLSLALGSIGNAQTISNAPQLPSPPMPTDQIFIFRGNTPVYSTTIAALLSGLQTGVFGPASSNSGYIPLWNGTLGNSLSGGLAVGQTGNNTVVETGASGLISTSILPSSVSLLGNVVTGSGNVVLQTAPTLTSAVLTAPILTSGTLNSPRITTPTISATGALFLGSASGVVTLLAAANAGAGQITLPNVTGNAVTTGDVGTVTDAMLSASSIIINGTSCQLGAGCTVPLSFNNPTIINANIKFTTLPTGTPKTYACFDVNGRLISFWARCAP